MTTAGALDVSMLPASASGDLELVTALDGLINDVYAVAEEGLWLPGAARTTVAAVADLVHRGQLAVASAGGQIIGCVRVRFLGADAGEFGMLAVVPARRGTGAGRELVRFAERVVRAEGRDTMQLELLVPQGWSHPSKEFLAGWYTRAGYRQVRVGAVEESYPELAPLLATPCDFAIYRKHLAAAGS